MADVLLSIGARDQTGAGLRRVQNRFAALGRDATRSLRPLQQALGALGGPLGALGGAGLAAGLGAAVTQTINRLGELTDVARRYGIEAERALAQEQAFRIAGQGLDALEDSYGTLLERVGELALGEKTAIELWRALGLDIQDLAGQSGDQVVALTVKALAAIEDPALRAQAAIALAGDESGKALLDVAEAGEDTYRRLEESADSSIARQLQQIEDLRRGWRETLVDAEMFGVRAAGAVLDAWSRLLEFQFGDFYTPPQSAPEPRFPDVGIRDPFEDLGATGAGGSRRALDQALAQGAREAEEALQAAVAAQEAATAATRAWTDEQARAEAALLAWRESMIAATGDLTEQGAALLQNELLGGRRTEDLNAQERALLQLGIQQQAQAQLLEGNQALEALRNAALHEGNAALATAIEAQLAYRRSVEGTAELLGELQGVIGDRVFGGEQRRMAAAEAARAREQERARREEQAAARRVRERRPDPVRTAPAPILRTAAAAAQQTFNFRFNFYGNVEPRGLPSRMITDIQRAFDRGQLRVGI